MLKGLCLSYLATGFGDAFPLLLAEPHKAWPVYSGCLLSLPLMKMVEGVGDYHFSGFIVLHVQLSYSWVISHLSGCVLKLLRLFGWLWTLLLPATWSFLYFLNCKIPEPLLFFLSLPSVTFKFSFRFQVFLFIFFCVFKNHCYVLSQTTRLPSYLTTCLFAFSVCGTVSLKMNEWMNKWISKQYFITLYPFSYCFWVFLNM